MKCEAGFGEGSVKNELRVGVQSKVMEEGGVTSGGFMTRAASHQNTYVMLPLIINSHGCE